MHKAWRSVEEVPYNFSRSFIKCQGDTGWKIDDFNPVWVRLLGRSQLSNPSDLLCCTRMSSHFTLPLWWMCLASSELRFGSYQYLSNNYLAITLVHHSNQFQATAMGNVISTLKTWLANTSYLFSNRHCFQLVSLWKYTTRSTGFSFPACVI